MPSHYLNQCWNSVNLALKNNRRWNFNRNSYIVIHENVVWQMVAIVSWPQCVKGLSIIHPNFDTDVFECMKYNTKYHSTTLDYTDAKHYTDVIMGTMASQITSLTIVYSTVYSGAGQRKHQRSASLTFVRGIHRWPVHKGPVTFPFDDVIMSLLNSKTDWHWKSHSKALQ